LEDAVLAGARGFVLKASPVTRLIEALRTVAAEGTYVDPDLAPLLCAGAQVSLLGLLSPREREIINLLAEGPDRRSPHSWCSRRRPSARTSATR